MKDKIIKLKILYYLFLLPVYQNWVQHIWKWSLDNYYCCNGKDCGCQGMTIRELWVSK